MLHDEQKRAVDDSLKNPTNGFWMTIGSGKTLAALSLIQELNSNKNIIIIQPSNMLYWEGECKKYLDYEVFMPRSIKEFKKMFSKDLFNKERFILILKHASYWQKAWIKIYEDNDLVTKETVVILDESKVIARMDSQISKVTSKWLAERVTHFHQLTGTMLSTLDNLYIPLKLAKYKDMNFYDFANTFLVVDIGYLKQNGRLREYRKYKGVQPGKEDWLRFMVHQSGTVVNNEHMTKKKEEKVFRELPLEMEAACKKAFDVVTGPPGDRILEDKYPLLNSPSAMSAARQLASGFYKPKAEFGDSPIMYSNHKLEAVEDLLDSTDDDFLIFYVFKEECRQLIKLLRRKNIKTFQCNGSVKNHETRYDYKGRKVLLIQYQAGSEGLNLQDFHRTIYYSPTWKAHLYMQSQGRTNRIGQKYTCYYYKLITSNTAEKRTYDTLETMQDYNDYLMSVDAETMFQKRND